MYDDVTQYWNAFLLEVAYPAMEDCDFSSYEKELDEAEKLFREKYLPELTNFRN